MKEWIEIEDKEVKEICDDCIMSENCKKKNTYEQARCCFNFQFIPANIEVEKEPTTWEDLKELCKGLKGINIFPFFIEYNETNHSVLCFTDAGTIVEPNSVTCFAEQRTYAQMWHIIKNLVDK